MREPFSLASSVSSSVGSPARGGKDTETEAKRGRDGRRNVDCNLPRFQGPRDRLHPGLPSSVSQQLFLWRLQLGFCPLQAKGLPDVARFKGLWKEALLESASLWCCKFALSSGSSPRRPLCLQWPHISRRVKAKLWRAVPKALHGPGHSDLIIVPSLLSTVS